MSATEDGSVPLEDYPEFDLDYRFDEDESEVTLVPQDPEDVTTEWLTIDADFAVPIEETV